MQFNSHSIVMICGRFHGWHECCVSNRPVGTQGTRSKGCCSRGHAGPQEDEWQNQRFQVYFRLAFRRIPPSLVVGVGWTEPAGGPTAHVPTGANSLIEITFDT